MAVFAGKGPQTPAAKRMLALTPSPGQAPDWDSIRDLWPETRALAGCEQDPVHHAEGDADIHTSMVLRELCASGQWQSMPAPRRSILFWAAVLHDSGKPLTTAREEDGRITSVGHSRAGSAIARRLLWEAGVEMAAREEICSLILAHQVPFWLFERPDAARAARRLSLSLSADDLLVHVQADARGRICADLDGLLERIELSRLVFEEAGCESAPFPFANDESRVTYFERDDRDPHYEAHEDFRCTATLVCGLPGTGKDTWIGTRFGTQPVVSLDCLREELGIGPLDNQGRVIQAAQEAAREHLRASRDFVWNATNVTRQNRERVIRLLRDYGARVRIHYLETDPDTLLEQNGSRKASVPADAILKLSRKMEPPQPWEGHEVRWFFKGEEVPLPCPALPLQRPAALPADTRRYRT